MGIKSTLSILRFEFHALGNILIITALMVMMFHFFSTWEQSAAVLMSFAIIVFLISLVRIDLGLAILIVGMLFSPEVTLGATRTREVTIRAEDLLILSLMMAWVVRRVMMGTPWRATPLNWPILAFLVSSTLSTMGGIALGWIDPTLAIFYFGKLVEFFAVYFFAIHFIEDRKQVYFFLGIFLVVGFMVSLYGLNQIGHTHRITAPFEGGTPEPNTFGGYLMTILAMSVSLAVFTPSIVVRIVLFIISGTAISALMFTLSRASFLGCIGMFVLLAAMTRSKVLWFGLILFVFLHPYILPEAVMDRINYTFQHPRGEVVQMPFRVPFVGETITVDSSTYERIDVWRKVLYTWTFNGYYFFFGWGITRNHILDSQFARFLVEIGLVGTGLFAWIMWRIFSISRQLWRETENWVVKGFTTGYIACFAGVLIHSLGTITFYIVRIMEPFWFLTGVLFWFYLLEHQSPDSEDNLPDTLWQPELPWRQVDA